MNREVVIRPGDPRNPEAAALLKASHALMQALFAPEENHFLSVEALAGPDILFFIAELDGHVAGCAALALKDGYGEVKSMYVDPARRGARIGARLLDRLEAEARARELPLLRLETGDSLVAARKLYTSQGYRIREPFGDYAPAKTSIFMEKKL